MARTADIHIAYAAFRRFTITRSRCASAHIPTSTLHAPIAQTRSRWKVSILSSGDARTPRVTQQEAKQDYVLNFEPIDSSIASEASLISWIYYMLSTAPVHP